MERPQETNATVTTIFSPSQLLYKERFERSGRLAAPRSLAAKAGIEFPVYVDDNDVIHRDGQEDGELWARHLATRTQQLLGQCAMRAGILEAHGNIDEVIINPADFPDVMMQELLQQQNKAHVSGRQLSLEQYRARLLRLVSAAPYDGEGNNQVARPPILPLVIAGKSYVAYRGLYLETSSSARRIDPLE